MGHAVVEVVEAQEAGAAVEAVEPELQEAVDRQA